MRQEQTMPTLEENKLSSKPEKTEPSKKAEYEDNDPVTVIWKSWGTNGMPHNRTTYFDRYTFVGGVGRRVLYKDVKKWLQQGHGLLVFDANATEEDFIRATGHKPLDDDKFATLLRATPPDKIAALLGPDALDKIAAFHRK